MSFIFPFIYLISVSNKSKCGNMFRIWHSLMHFKLILTPDAVCFRMNTNESLARGQASDRRRDKRRGSLSFATLSSFLPLLFITSNCLHQHYITAACLDLLVLMCSSTPEHKHIIKPASHPFWSIFSNERNSDSHPREQTHSHRGISRE